MRQRVRTEPAPDGGRSAATGLSSVDLEDLAEWRGGRRVTALATARDARGGAGGSCRARAADGARPTRAETRRESGSPDHTVRSWAEGWGGEVDGRWRKDGSTGTRRVSSAGRAIEPGSARTGGRREMAQSPSPSVMTGGTVESGRAGFPEQSAPEQGVGRDGGVSSWGGSTDPLRISGSRAKVSAAACVREVR